MNRFGNFNDEERKVLEIFLSGAGIPASKKLIEIMKNLSDELSELINEED